MSNIQVQLRRGTTAQHSSFTGAQGELTVDTDKNALVLHDGATAGGIQVARQDAVNVKDFGAVGDGTNDDTSAFQAAIATGLNVYVPEVSTNYKVTASLGTMSRYQSIVGEGFVKIIVDTSTDYTLLTLGSDCKVENFWFDGTSTANGTAIKVSNGSTASDQASSSVIRDCWLRGFNKGYACDISTDIRFYNVQLRNNQYGAYLNPIPGDDTEGYLATYYFNGCRFYSNSVNDVYLKVPNTSRCRVITFEGCTFDPLGDDSRTTPSISLENAALVNLNNCYLEASTAGTCKQLEAVGSPFLSITNCIMTKTGGISLDNSSIHLKNVWSFGNEADSADHDPIIATNNSKVIIEDATMRGTGHDFINGTTHYKIINSTVTLGGVARFYKHKVGGSNANELLELHDSSDNKLLEVDQDSLNIVSGNLELAGNNKIYTGTGGLVSSGGALTFRLSSVDTTIRPVMIKVFFQGRDTSNNAVTNQASCEYVFTAVNVAGGVCQVSPVTTVHEYVFSAASHFSVTLNPSSLNDTIDVVLTNPVSGQTLNNTFYKVELLGSAWDLDSVTAS
jgi:hypothetical protein